MKFLLILLLLGVFAANAQEQDEGELSQEYPEEYPAGMVDEDEVSEGELQEESEDELSEDELADGMVEGEKPVGSWYRAGLKGGKIVWKYRRPIGKAVKHVFHALTSGRRRRRFRRELQEESEDELSEDELADGMVEGEKPVGGGWYRAGKVGGRIVWKYRRPIRKAVKHVFHALTSGRRRRRFRRSLAEEEVSDDDDIACFGACIGAGLTAAQIAYNNRHKIGRFGRRTGKIVGGWFSRRRRSRRRRRRKGF